jgi:hypothetical protein
LAYPFLQNALARGWIALAFVASGKVSAAAGRRCEQFAGCLLTPKPALIFVIGNKEAAMCRNIKTLFNFDPPATREEIDASALQFVRKLSGFNKPSQANAEAFDRAVAEVADAARRLLSSLHTHAPSRDRDIEAERARERARVRFA